MGHGVTPGVQVAARSLFTLCSVPQQDTKLLGLLGSWGQGATGHPQIKRFKTSWEAGDCPS